MRRNFPSAVLRLPQRRGTSCISTTTCITYIDDYQSEGARHMADAGTRAPKADKSESNYGKLTEEGIARLRAKLGIQFNQPRTAHNFEVSWDGSRHFANGYGDANPLWCDPEYGRGTRWGGLIAAPGF